MHQFISQELVNYLIFGLSTLLVYFILFFGYVQIYNFLRKNRKRKLIKELNQAVCEYRKKNKNVINDIRGLKSDLGIEAMSQVVIEMDKRKANQLKKLIMDSQLKKFIVKSLKTRDQALLTFNVKLIGELDMDFLSHRIVRVLYRYPKNSYLQYSCLITLCKFGERRQIEKIFLDDDFDIILTRRALQEVFCAYSGNKKSLYAKLLGAKNPYVVRICLDSIGAKELKGLATKIMPFLESEDGDVLIAVIRALGKLKEERALTRIKELVYHDNWRVRIVAIEALAEINFRKSCKSIKGRLYDSEWLVSYAAANVLVKMGNSKKIYNEIVCTGSSQAKEIFEFVMARKKLVGGRKKHESNPTENSLLR